MGQGIEVVRVGVFVGLRKIGKREHRLIFGGRIVEWPSIIHICQPPMFTGLDRLNALFVIWGEP